MFDGEDMELALYALEDGMTPAVTACHTKHGRAANYTNPLTARPSNRDAWRLQSSASRR